jgi:hypothetical protein
MAMNPGRISQFYPAVIHPLRGAARYTQSSMDYNRILVLALANVPTMITVLIGILLNNARISDLNTRMTSMENRLTNLDHKFDTRFDLLLSKVIEIGNRLTRLEPRNQ